MKIKEGLKSLFKIFSRPLVAFQMIVFSAMWIYVGMRFYLNTIEGIFINIGSFTFISLGIIGFFINRNEKRKKGIGSDNYQRYLTWYDMLNNIGCVFLIIQIPIGIVSIFMKDKEIRNILIITHLILYLITLLIFGARKKIKKDYYKWLSH